MTDLAELVTSAVITVAAVAFSPFGVEVERTDQDQARAAEARSVRRSPMASTRSRAPVVTYRPAN
jgi:hypothetical protein